MKKTDASALPFARTSLLFCTICARPNLSLRKSSPRFSIFPFAPIPTRSGGIPSVPPRRSFASSTGWRILAPSSAAASNSSTHPSSPIPVHSPPRLFSRRNIRQKSSGKLVNRKASSPPHTPPGTNKAREGFSPLALFDVFWLSESRLCGTACQLRAMFRGNAEGGAGKPPSFFLDCRFPSARRFLTIAVFRQPPR